MPGHLKSLNEIFSIFQKADESSNNDRVYKQLKLVDLEVIKLRNPYIYKRDGPESTDLRTQIEETTQSSTGKLALALDDYVGSVKAWSEGMFVGVFGETMSVVIFDMMKERLQNIDLGELAYDYALHVLTVEKVEKIRF